MASLGTAVRVWPTPTAQAARHGAPTEWEKASGRNGLWIAAAKVWPTPTAGIHRSGQTSEATATKNSRPLQERVERGGQGRLNPAWVEMLMGFPPGWTDTAGPPLRDLSTPESHPGPDPASRTTESD